MKAMIMAAGVGSRLMPMTSDIPKPMIPVANRPLMENTVNLLSQYGTKEIIANLHYHGDVIRNYFADGSAWADRFKKMSDKHRKAWADAFDHPAT
jgi:mannose-1-phosphate guanylyltransferase/mannose-1-phosphate guanylyltransferase/phosphomannomutase